MGPRQQRSPVRPQGADEISPANPVARRGEGGVGERDSSLGPWLCFGFFFFFLASFFSPSCVHTRRWRGHISLPGRRLACMEGQTLPTRRQLLSASLRSLPRTYVGCQGADAVTGCSSSRGELMRADGDGCDRLIGREQRGPSRSDLGTGVFCSHVFQGTD